MQPRQDIIEIFSTFLQFNADRFQGWATDPKLRRSMQKCVNQSSQPEVSENFWAIYWHKVWQNQPNELAVGHLSAYLQEVCYWTARNIATNLLGEKSIADFFQIAISKTNKVLKGFNPQQGSSLKKYAALAFSSAIKDTLRQRQEVDVCTNWALLHKLSQKRLVESLERQQGINQEAIAAYILAWKCFKLIYAPSTARTNRQQGKPDPATWEAIANLYNTERISQLPGITAAVTPEILEKWLTACGKAARSYIYPTLVSTDAPKPGQESGGLIDTLPAAFEDSLLTEIIEQEEEKTRKSQRTQLNSVLLKALVKQDVQSQKLLQLYYGQGLTQQQIAEQLEMKQYTVSRRLTSLRQSLLLALAQWSQDTMHYSLNSDVLNYISTVLEEWLKGHYSHPDLPP